MVAEIKKVYDPEIPVNIYDLGLISRIEIQNEQNSTPKLPIHVISDQGSDQGFLLE